MCIIVYKPTNSKMPSEETLRRCFINNSDGAGYMFNGDDKVVYIKKGFMDFESFYESLKSDVGAVGEKREFVLHFRISTQGGRQPQLTHPYVYHSHITYSKMKELSTKGYWGIAHNGVFSITSSHATDHNDTMEFIKDYLTVLIRHNRKWYTDTKIKRIITALCGTNKLAILDGGGHTELIGDFVESDGCFFSNTTYSYERWVPRLYTANKEKVTDIAQKAYNTKTKMYDFKSYNCPCTMGDYTYCDKCSHADECFYY